MVIPGIPDDQLERIHYYLGPGNGSGYAYKHIPSGILAGGTKPPQMNIHQFDLRLIADLTEKLKAAEIISETQSE
jgi:hypothetical protein